MIYFFAGLCRVWYWKPFLYVPRPAYILYLAVGPSLIIIVQQTSWLGFTTSRQDDVYRSYRVLY